MAVVLSKVVVLRFGEILLSCYSEVRLAHRGLFNLHAPFAQVGLRSFMKRLATAVLPCELGVRKAKIILVTPPANPAALQAILVRMMQSSCRRCENQQLGARSENDTQAPIV